VTGKNNLPRLSFLAESRYNPTTMQAVIVDTFSQCPGFRLFLDETIFAYRCAGTQWQPTIIEFGTAGASAGA